MPSKTIFEPAAADPMSLPLLTTDLAAETLGIPTSTFDALIQDGRGPKIIKIGRRRFVSPVALRAWAAAEYEKEYGDATP